MKSQIANRKSQIRPVPEWVMIARVGEWRGHPSGPEVIARAHLEGALDYFERHYRAHGADLAVDYHHASVLASQGRLDRAPAAGWIREMELRAGGAELWGRVMWTGDAAASIAAGEFRHVSPVLRFGAPDRVSGEPVPMLVHSLALTNTPFLTELAALNEQAAPPAPESTSEKGGEDMPILEQMAAALGREEDELKAVFGLDSAEDREVAEALLALAARLKELEAGEGQPAPAAGAAQGAGEPRLNAMCEALGLPSGSDERALLGAIDALRADERDREAARLVEEAVRAGRIPPSQREFFLNCARRDPEGTRECLGGLPVMMAPRAIARAVPARRRELTDGEEGVCRQLGLTSEAFLAVAERESRAIEP